MQNMTALVNQAKTLVAEGDTSLATLNAGERQYVGQVVNLLAQGFDAIVAILQYVEAQAKGNVQG